MMPDVRRALARALCVVPATLVALSCEGAPTAGGDATDYVLELRWLGTPPAGATLAAFETARATLTSTIVGPVPAVLAPANFNVSQCNPGDAHLAGFPNVTSRQLKGLVIYILVRPMDGAGGTLGSAGPCLVRGESANHLPALGVMQFDEVDVAAQTAERLERIVLHEMLHVVGVGTIWPDLDLLIDSATTDARFIGPRARAACANVNGGGAHCADNVPVHSDTAAGAAGSSYAHWRESLFTTELMTPFLNAGGVPIPFSAMTIESLGDLGYVVSALPAQAFTVTGTLLWADDGGQPGPGFVMSEPTRPVYVVDSAGRLTPFRTQR